jgi:hypothetical protein
MNGDALFHIFPPCPERMPGPCERMSAAYGQVQPFLCAEFPHRFNNVLGRECERGWMLLRCSPPYRTRPKNARQFLSLRTVRTWRETIFCFRVLRGFG